MKAKEPKTKTHLKRVMKTIWQEMGKKQEMCRRLMLNNSFWLEAVIELGGMQGKEKNYRKKKNVSITV